MSLNVLDEEAHELTHELLPIINKYNALVGMNAMLGLVVNVCQRDKPGQGDPVKKSDFLDLAGYIWDEWASLKNMAKVEEFPKNKCRHCKGDLNGQRNT